MIYGQTKKILIPDMADFQTDFFVSIVFSLSLLSVTMFFSTNGLEPSKDF